MRSACILFILLASVRVMAAERAATLDEIVLLQTAFRNSPQERERWAYTETRRAEIRKKNPGDTVIRFDPSLPYAEQFQPLLIDGKPPTEKDLKEYRKRGLRRGERVAKAAEAARNPAAATAPTASLRFGGTDVSLDVTRSRVVAETAATLTFLIPISSKVRDVPADKLRVELRVTRAEPVMDHLHVTVAEAFRVKLVVKIKAGEMDLDFERVDPNFGPVITHIEGDLDASMLFIPADGKFLSVRRDWKRVKPYDERFEVKLGDMKLMDY